MAKLDVSVVAEVSLHAPVEKPGAGTTIIGLRPAAPTSLMEGEIALSPSIDPLTAVGSGNGEAIVEPVPAFKALSVATGVHAPDMTDVPNGDVAGGVVPSGEGTGGIAPMPIALLKPAPELKSVPVAPEAAPATPVVGHATIVPMALPCGELKLPILSWIVPNWFPVVPTVATDPDIPIGEVIRIVVDVLDVGMDVTCAEDAPQPNKAMAAVVRTKRCIDISRVRAVVPCCDVIAMPADRSDQQCGHWKNSISG
jgi:hypothetical protein